MRIAKTSVYLLAALMLGVTACYGGEEAGGGDAGTMGTPESGAMADTAGGAMADTTQANPAAMADTTDEPDSPNP